MQLNTLNQCHLQDGVQHFEIDYFLTMDSTGGGHLRAEEVRLVLSISGSENQKHCITKSVAIIKQPREVIEIIVRREALALMGQSIA